MAEMATTSDDYLGGRLKVRQPAKGYRAGVDPVLLAAFVRATAGQSVLELGCGVGVASLCLGSRVSGLRLTGLEQQADYAALARANAAANEIAMHVIEGDLAAMPEALRQQQFDHVIANPPYFLRSASSPAQDAGREAALGEETPLANWIKAAAKRCAPKGTVSFIHRAERLPELLALMGADLGGVCVQPLVPRAGKPARLVLVSGRKGARAAFCLKDSIVMHAGATHTQDAENYAEPIRCVLREGAALEN